MTPYERFADLAVWLVISIAAAVAGTILSWYLEIAISALIRN